MANNFILKLKCETKNTVKQYIKYKLTQYVS